MKCATIFAAAAVALLSQSAMAADLYGNGLADLEERIAELEATTVRKGNRKVTLQISGYVTHSVMWWDDGRNKDMYIGDGGPISSRFRITGDAKISPALTAGFTYEFGVHNNLIGQMTQGVGGDDLGGAFLLRDSTVWLRHQQLGMLKIGHGSTATDNLILIDLGGVSSAVTPDAGLFNGSFQLNTATTASGVTWNQMLNGGISFDTARRNHVLYETPSLAGFTLQAAVAENSFWDVALRFKTEFGGFRLAAGAGYSVDKESPTYGALLLPASDIKTLMGSASLMHVQSGLFINAAGGQRKFGGSQATYSAGECLLLICAPGTGTGSASATDATFWHVTGGWNRNHFGIGSTVLYAEYMKADDMIGYSGMWNPAQPNPLVPDPPNAPFSVSSQATMYGFGVVQHIDAAAMQLFLSYKKFSGEVNAVGANGPLNDTLNAKDFSAVIGGVKLSF